MLRRVTSIDPTIIDISIPVSPATAEWPGDTPFSCGWSWDMAAGSSVNVSSVTMSPHVGTHADAPIHVQQGGIGADQLPLGAFHGPAVVVDVSDLTGPIKWSTLSERISAAGEEQPERVLLKTGRTIADGPFPDMWPMLSRDCAEMLAKRHLRLFAVDCPSVDDRNSKTLDVHHVLFDHDVCVLENLDLRQVNAGRYTLVAFPTKFVDLDAAPVRAVLFPLQHFDPT